VTRRRAVVVGGSVAGLMAGNLLARLGWEVDVFERAPGALEDRGAGITILPGLVDGLRAAGVDASEASLGIELPSRIAVDRHGRIVGERPFPQYMTSWRRLYESLRAAFPGRYHAGVALVRVEQERDGVIATFSDGASAEADLLIGADGLRSTVRGLLLPHVEPSYPGYVAWRCLTDEAELTASTAATLLGRYAICVAPGEQGIGYPVPGRERGREYNVVWYHPVSDADELPRMLTDATGRHHPNGIAPSLIRDAVREEMRLLAGRVLAPQFAESIQRARVEFFQPIVDLESSRLVFGRVVLVGDAAFVARPHVAMGVPKAFGDVLALVHAVREPGDPGPALRAFEAERLRVGRAIVARGRRLGAYMEAQLGPDEARGRAEERRDVDELLAETAAPADYGDEPPN
jgi:2-polyprenyl-6-methoxyphenol hydroxylase-like FAD-dependent oxidoreductase